MKYKFLLRSLVLYPTCAVLVGIGLLAIATLIPRKWNFDPTDSCEFTVYLTSDGFHTNFVVPVDTSAYSWRQKLDLDRVAPNQHGANQHVDEQSRKILAEDYQYLQFGWGDRRFYMETPSWDKVKPTEVLRALFFWQNSSALFVKGHTEVPHYPNEQVKCVRLNKTDYLALMNFIDHSFQLGSFQLDSFQIGPPASSPESPSGQPIPTPGKQRLGSGQDQESGFYAATGSYSILRTCNSWTADGLRVANVNTPLWAGLANPVMAHLRNGCQCVGVNVNDSGKDGNEYSK